MFVIVDIAALSEEGLPVAPTVAWVKGLAEAGHRVELWSGRPASEMDEVVEWLAAQTVPVAGAYELKDAPATTVGLRMRADADGSETMILFDRWLQQLADDEQMPDIFCARSEAI